MFSDLFTRIFDDLNSKLSAEIKLINEYFPSADLVYRCSDNIPSEKVCGTTSRTLRIEFGEAISMLREAGVDEEEQGEYEDLSTVVEKKLGTC